MSELDEIRARVHDCATYNFGMRNADKLAHEDAPRLLKMIEEMQTKLDAVAVLAEAWRYKGEFGWGAWQEGHGPDMEGTILDDASGALRGILFTHNDKDRRAA